MVLILELLLLVLVLLSLLTSVVRTASLVEVVVILLALGQIELPHLGVVVPSTWVVVHVGVLVVDSVSEEFVLLMQGVLHLVSCDLLVVGLLLVAGHAKTTAVSHLRLFLLLSIIH